MFSDLASHRLTAQALTVLLFAPILLLASCAGPGHSVAAPPDAAISPGAGQSLAGTPGATGPDAAASGATAMPGMTMSSAPGGASVAPVAGTTVAVKNFAFAPATLTVKAGTTVTWTNQDTDAHTVTSHNAGGPLRSPALGTGKSYSYTFTKAGSYAYLCTIHPFMTATVTVTQ
ncbi:cupredoxin family copper-binding protein [Streptomyces sp. NPDC001401]|uniref:cupredoxin domain-containing protein n=1 Tax=Streptomyces sp. NPDC001401 TaxID=3364570 RepID=UPI00367E3A18